MVSEGCSACMKDEERVPPGAPPHQGPFRVWSPRPFVAIPCRSLLWSVRDVCFSVFRSQG